MNSFKKASMAVVTAAVFGIAGIAMAECPQTRETKKAADADFNARNPKTSAEDIKEGGEIYQGTKKVAGIAVACSMCHGKEGNGDGPAGKAFKSPKAPRAFTCKDTMKDISEGQMFWIIKNGSPGTGMTAQKAADDDIWKVVAYIRKELSKL